jgi:hypothetical protein
MFPFHAMTNYTSKTRFTCGFCMLHVEHGLLLAQLTAAATTAAATIICL